MKYLDRWAESLLARRSLPLKAAVHIVGLRKSHLGPRMDFGEVEFIAEPAGTFEVSLEVPNVGEKPEWSQFIESAIFGFLDVVMLEETYPYKNFKLRVVGAKFNPVDSNSLAFRLAGRDAGKKFLAEIRASKCVSS
jgi:hypothetical protein